MTHVFRSPKFHKELRMQYGPDKAISKADSAYGGPHSVRCGSRPQASSSKLQARKPEPSSGSSNS